MNDIYKIKDEWLKNAMVNKEQYEMMYKEVIGYKEPSPDVVEVEKLSVGQSADPSLKKNRNDAIPGKI